MKVESTVKNRIFNFSDISEREAIVLRTLLNLNELGVKERLDGDRGYWDVELSEGEAIKIGVDLCKCVIAKVDEDR